VSKMLDSIFAWLQPVPQRFLLDADGWRIRGWVDAALCLPEATGFESVELERPEAICGLESGTWSRLWSTRGDCSCRQEGAFFEFWEFIQV